MLKSSLLKILPISFLLIAVLSIAAYSQTPCNKIEVSSLGISFCAPPKWLIKESDNYPVALGERRENFTPSINIRSENMKMSLADYVKNGLDYLLENKEKIGAPSLNVKSQTKFSSVAGSGYKIVLESVSTSGVKFRTIQYAFNANGDTKIVITGTMPSPDKDGIEEVTDEAAKSYKVGTVVVPDNIID